MRKNVPSYQEGRYFLYEKEYEECENPLISNRTWKYNTFNMHF